MVVGVFRDGCSWSSCCSWSYCSGSCVSALVAVLVAALRSPLAMVPAILLIDFFSSFVLSVLLFNFNFLIGFGVAFPFQF